MADHEYTSYTDDDDEFFQSAMFFYLLNGLFFCSFGLVHLVHWIINLIIEYKNTRSCGASQRHEGVKGWILLIVGFLLPMTLIVWYSFYIPKFTYLNFGPDDCCQWYIPIAWFGTVLSIIDVLAFAYVHFSLGLSWSGTVTVKQDHKLVTSGAYRFARHPMYAVVAAIPIITLIQTTNWLYSLAWAIAFFYPISRCRKEERLMQEQFGDEYREYMDRVGPFFPCNIPGWGNKTDTSGFSALDEEAYGDINSQNSNSLFDE